MAQGRDSAADPPASSSAPAISTQAAVAPAEPIPVSSAVVSTQAAVVPAEPIPVSSAAVSTQAAVAPAEPIPVSSAAVSTQAAPAPPFQLPGTSPPAAESKDISAGPWVIGEVKVDGLHNIKPRSALAQIQAKNGQIYRRSEVDRDVQALLGMGNFERVTVDVSELAGSTVPASMLEGLASTSAVRLAFQVVERPIVQKIDFAGNDEVGRSRLTDAMTTKEGDPFDTHKARSDMEKVLDVYREKGYSDASVDYSTSSTKDPYQLNMHLSIHEGKKTKVVAVIVEGAQALNPKKVARQMENHPGWLFSTAFQPKKMDDDLAAVEKYYKSKGHLDYKLVSSTVTFNADRSEATVVLKVEEGPLYYFGETAFSGNVLYSDDELRKVLLYRPGDVFDQDTFQETIQSIQELYANKGRLKAQIKSDRTQNQKTGYSDVALKIEEGQEIHVGHVDVEGNHATKTHVFTREMLQHPGDPFSAALVKKTQQRIMNLGFIDNVDISVLPSPDDPSAVDLTYTILEGKPGMLTAGAGLSSLEGLVGTLSLSHLNLFGEAQRLSLQWQFGAKVQNYQVSWSEPWIDDNHPVSLGVDAYNTHLIRPFATDLTAYTDERTGGRVRLGPRFQADLYQANFSYTLEHVAITNVDPSIASELSAADYVNSAVGAEFARDTRDNIWDPTSGTRNSIGMNFAGGPLFGNLNYVQPVLSNAWHHKIMEVGDYPITLSFFNRFGFIEPYGSTSSVPIFQRFFVGGQDTLRGYAVNGQVGPSNGGTVEEIFNTELKLPLAREHRRTIVAWVFFFDMGGAWDDFNHFRSQIGQYQTDIKTDVGFGIRFTTPAFPIRLDWGYGLNHQTGETKYQVNFGLGNLF